MLSKNSITLFALPLKYKTKEAFLLFIVIAPSSLIPSFVVKYIFLAFIGS